MTEKQAPDFDASGMPNDAMRRIVRCPACMTDNLLWNVNEGAQCSNCLASFPFHKGAWCAAVPDASWRSVLQDSVALFNDFTINRDAAREATSVDPQQTFESYDTAGHIEREDYFERAWRELGLPAGALILEVGAGDLRAAARLAGRGYHLVAVEPVPEFLTRGAFGSGHSIAKICGSVSRLPFEDGSFDAVLAHATLHHFDTIPPLMREMGRVLRPGGSLIAIGEPYSAPFSNIERIHTHVRDFSFDIGANERTPRFAEYIAGFRAAGVGGICAYAEAGDLRPPQRLARLRPFRTLAEGTKQARGWGMWLRHGLSHGRVSLRGIRTGRAIAKPASIDPARFPFTPDDYLLRRDRADMIRKWRSVTRAEDFPQRISVGMNDIQTLRRGFSPRYPDADGTPFKWMQRQGAFFLRVGASAGVLTVRLRRRPGDALGSIRAFQDEFDLGARPESEIREEGWTNLAWPIHEQPAQGFSEFRLVAERLAAHEGMAVSLMIREVACG